MSIGRGSQDHDLSQEEVAVLRLVADGLSDEEIATHLRIMDSEVREHIQAIQARMGTQSRTETAIRAMRLGMVCIVASVMLGALHYSLALPAF